ncbi:MAG: glycosyltransferase family 2 protein [Myxococcota bacterium]
MSDKETIAFSVVIPCYRSARWLPELVARLDGTMASLGASFEILLVNDASPDSTWQVIEGLATRFRSVRGFDLLANAGQFRATLCGLKHARGEIVITLDDDLQNLPEDIPKLLRALEADPNLDCVMAAYGRGKHGIWLRDAATHVVARIRRSLRSGHGELQMSAFRAMRRPVVKALCEARTRRPILGPMILELCDRVANVDVEFAPRAQGESGYGVGSLLRILRDEVVASSTLPLTGVATTGAVVAAGSLLLGLYYLVRYVSYGTSVAGFTTLVLLIIFFGGTTLLSIGILGQYVARVLHEVSAPTWYQVRRETGASALAKTDPAAPRDAARQDQRADQTGEQ